MVFVALSSVSHADLMLTPGAKMSRQGPRFEKSASTSEIVVAPTVDFVLRTLFGVVVIADLHHASRCSCFTFRVRYSNAGLDDVGMDARCSGVACIGEDEGEIILIEPVQIPAGIRYRVDDVHSL